MAICADCSQEMLAAASCTAAVLVIGEQRYPRTRWRRPRRAVHSRCGDCGVEPGGVHHLGCDLERCPACGWQLISCPCTDGDEDPVAETPVRASPPA